MKVRKPNMVNPSTDALLKKTKSRYTLVVLASKRKFVTNAMREIVENKITYRIQREHRK